MAKFLDKHNLPKLIAHQLKSQNILIVKKLNLFLLLFSLFLLGPHVLHMEVPGLEVKLQLQLPAYTTATAWPNPSHIFELCCSSLQHRILNPLSKARDLIRNLMDTSWVLNLLSRSRNSEVKLL